MNANTAVAVGANGDDNDYDDYDDDDFEAAEELKRAEKEELDFHIPDSDFDDPPARELDPPHEKAAPPTPVENPRHFEPPDHVAVGMQEETDLGETGVDAIDPTFADLMGGDGDVAMDQKDSSMMHVLRHIGVDEKVAAHSVASVADPSSTFMEIFGRGGIVAEAHKQRRSLNVKGLDAFDIRTTKPDGGNWDFN